MKTSLFPNLSARYLEKEIPIIIKVIPPALNKPKPADIGSSPKKLSPNDERIFKAQSTFLLLFLFRGHFIQVCLFLVKLSLLLLILLWITKKLQMLNFKVD